MTVAILILAYR